MYWLHQEVFKPHTKAKAQIYVLNKEEGGRHTPFFKGYRPQFFFGTADVTGVVELPEGVEMVMPGDNLTVEIDLQKNQSLWNLVNALQSVKAEEQLVQETFRRFCKFILSKF